MNHNSLREESLLGMIRFAKRVIDSGVINNPAAIILLSGYLD